MGGAAVKRVLPAISYEDRLAYGAMPGSSVEFVKHAFNVCREADAELARMRRAAAVLRGDTEQPTTGEER